MFAISVKDACSKSKRNNNNTFLCMYVLNKFFDDLIESIKKKIL